MRPLPTLWCEMIDFLEARADDGRLGARLHHEVDVVDSRAGLAVDQVDEASAHALDRRNVELHRTHGALDLLGTRRHGVRERERRVLDAKGHGAHARPVFTREALRETIRFGVDDEVDAALTVQRHVLGAVAGNTLEAHGLEEPAEVRGIGGGVFDEFEAVRPERILPTASARRVSLCPLVSLMVDLLPVYDQED